MTSPSFLAIGFLGSLAANVLHWRGRSGERLLYLPAAGLLRLFFASWMIASPVTAIMFLLDVIPMLTFLGVSNSFCIAHQLYSIVRRHQDRVHS
jgi:CHASE2 domain-containing sensor protein